MSDRYTTEFKDRALGFVDDCCRTSSLAKSVDAVAGRLWIDPLLLMSWCDERVAARSAVQVSETDLEHIEDVAKLKVETGRLRRENEELRQTVLMLEAAASHLLMSRGRSDGRQELDAAVARLRQARAARTDDLEPGQTLALVTSVDDFVEEFGAVI